MGIIEARAVISATDKTGGVFDKLAGKFKEIANSAKALDQLKPLKGIGSAEYASKLSALKATAAEMAIIQKSARDFQNALKSSGPMQAGRYMDAIGLWRARTIESLRAVRADMATTERAQHRFFGKMGAGRFAATTLGLGSGAYAAQRGARGTALAGATSIREGARDYLAGVSEADSARIKTRSGELSKAYPSIAASTMHERLRDTAMSMRSVDKAFEVADAIAKGTVVLQSLKGKDQAVEDGRKFFRGLDVLGKNQDPKQVEGLFNGYIKALGVEGADLNLGDVLQVAKQSRAAGLALSDRFLMSTVPGLIGDMGASPVGTALASDLAQTIGGRATKESKAFQQKYGMRDRKGNFVDKQLLQSDPDQYAWSKLIPAMQKAGVGPDDSAGVTEFLSKAFSNRTVADLFGKLVLQRAQYQGKDAQYQKAPGLSAAAELPTRDPFVAAEGFISQLKNFAAALSDPIFPAATAALNSISGGLGALAQKLGAGDRGERIGAFAGTGLLGGFGAYGAVKATKGAAQLYQWFTGAGALTGSATALNASAAALTAAATQLAGANAIDKAAKAAGPAASAATAAAGGGAGAWLARVGALAGGVVASPAALAVGVAAGLAAIHESKEAAGTLGLTGAEAAKKTSGGSRLDHLRKSFGEERERLGVPGAGDQKVKAEIDGNATLTGTITVSPSPDFMTKIDAKIDSKINAFKSTGITSSGSSGSTGRASPDASPAP